MKITQQDMLDPRWWHAGRCCIVYREAARLNAEADKLGAGPTNRQEVAE